MKILATSPLSIDKCSIRCWVLSILYGGLIKIVEPYASELPAAFEETGAELIDIDEALESCPLMVALTDHDMFKSIPLDQRAGKVVYDTRGIWPDQPDNLQAASQLRLAR